MFTSLFFGEGEKFEKYKRQTYLMAFPFGVAVCTLFSFSVWRQNDLLFSLGILMIVMMCALTVAVWRGTRYLNTVELIFYYFLSSCFLAITQIQVFAATDAGDLTPASLADSFYSLAMWMIVFMLASHLTLRPVQSRWFIGFIFGSLVVMAFYNNWLIVVHGQFDYSMLFRWINLFSSITVTILLIQRMGVLRNRHATTDALTGVMNRHSLYQALGQEMERSNRYRRALSVILFDIDHFKLINDTFGHLKGDRVLVEVSALVTHAIRQADHIGRWGGEEFLILLPETDLAEAHILAERIRVVMAATSFDGVDGITASFGVSTHKYGENMENLLHCADHALYQAKAAGRNRVSSASTCEKTDEK